MSDADIMDAHTLELLEFDKVRELLAGYAACSLGKELARQLEPSADADAIRAELALVSEMVDALGQGQAPPFGGLHDVRLIVRRAAIGAQLTVEQLLEVADTLTCTGNMYRYRMRLRRPPQWACPTCSPPVEDLGPVAKTITGCIDGRGHVLDMASPELAQVRQKTRRRRRTRAGPDPPPAPRSQAARRSSAIPTPPSAAIITSCPWPSIIATRCRASSTAPAAPARRSSSSRPASPASAPSGPSSRARRNARFAASCAG